MKVYKQWGRSTVYGDNSRESERRQNACYTWYYVRRQHEQKKKHIYRICLSSIYSTSMNFFERFFPSSFSRSSCNFFSFLLFFILRFSLLLPSLLIHRYPCIAEFQQELQQNSQCFFSPYYRSISFNDLRIDRWYIFTGLLAWQQ